MKKLFIFLAIFSIMIVGYVTSTVVKAETLPACTIADWSCADWGDCHADGNYFQNRTCNKITNCEGGVASPSTQQICTPPFCTSWTYADWGVCDPILGYQSRSEISAFPHDCIIDYTNGPGPINRQRCSVFPVCTLNDWSCGDWATCSSNNNQTRICSKTSNCQDGVISPAISQACVYSATIPVCTSFNYSAWSSCSANGTQTRSITSKFPYNCENGSSPITTQSCSVAPSCAADIWSCGDWNVCSISGVQSRSCRITFDCPSVVTAPPVTDQYCEAPNRPSQQAPQDSTVLNQNTIMKATVKLMCPFDEKWNKWMEGSGTVITQDGNILTNKHVIDGTLGCLVGFVNSFNDVPYFGDRQIADILKISSTADMAVLKLRNPNSRQLTYINIVNGNSNNLQFGTKINVYGYPTIFGKNMTYTSGDFGGVDGNYLKTNAIIEHGNSGGGAYLSDGSFIGIPSAVMKGELNSMGYILAINTINNWLGNSNYSYSNNSSNNNYSRVSTILEKIDLKTLGSVQLVVPGTKEYKEIINDSNNVVSAIFTRSLKVGMSGDDVKQLQTLLKKLNYFPGGQNITNYFGNITNSAVIKFQKDNNIKPAAGLFGPLTQAKLLLLSK